MDRDHPISDARYRVRKAIFDEVIASSNMEHDWESDRPGMELNLADERFHYLAFQYSHEGKGNEWATLGTDPVALIDSLADDEYWYSPHYLIDLDTGETITWETQIVITTRERSYDALIKATLHDQAAFLGLEP